MDSTDYYRTAHEVECVHCGLTNKFVIIEELVEDKKAISPESAAIQENTKETLGILLNTLSDREKTVIEMRFGLDGKDTKTLEECGKRLNITKERVRQIENSALKKLRNPVRTEKIKELLD